MDTVASGFELHKCANGQQLPKDRISQLPSDVLIYILSFLKFKEAVRTSLLSKHWTYLWTFFPRLDFDVSETLYKIVKLERKAKHEDLRERERRKYIELVNKVLESHKAMALDEFRVQFDLDSSSQKAIDKWLQFAVARKVQRLELDLSQDYIFCCNSLEPYTFPYGPFDLTSGNSLGESPRAFVDFNSLKALSLNKVNVSEEVLLFFLHNCRFLERVVVCRCGNLISLEISGPSPALEHLEICICYDLKFLSICDSNLVSLKTNAKEVVLKNVPRLVDIYVHRFSHNITGVLSQLSCCLSQLEVLTFFVFTKALRLKETRHELPQLPKLKQLAIQVSAPEEDESLLGLTDLIEASPNLEKLVIQMNWNSYRVRNRKKLEKAVNFPLQHLKVFEMSGYFGRTCEVELVKFFSENALTLERIIINTEDCPGTTLSPWEIKQQRVARRHAKQQLKGLIPANVDLQIL